MIRLLKNILGLAIIVFLLWYLSRRWDSIKILVKLDIKELLPIYLICFAGTVNTSCIVKCLLGGLKAKAGFMEMFLLQNATMLLNYLPMKFGTVFRAGYLKRHCGLSYAHFGTFFVYLTLLMTATASISGLVILIMVYGISGYESRILAMTFLVLLICSILGAFIPLPSPPGTNKWIVTIRNFLVSRHEIVRNKRVLVVCTAFLIGNFILGAIRIGIIYNSMGHRIHPAGYVILGSLGYVSMFLSFTPGALGSKELVLSAGAVALGIPFEVAILAAVIDRAITLIWCAVVGSVSTAWLWYKHPLDFKRVD